MVVLSHVTKHGTNGKTIWEATRVDKKKWVTEERRCSEMIIGDGAVLFIAAENELGPGTAGDVNRALITLRRG